MFSFRYFLDNQKIFLEKIKFRGNDAFEKCKKIISLYEEEKQILFSFEKKRALLNKNNLEIRSFLAKKENKEAFLSLRKENFILREESKVLKDKLKKLKTIRESLWLSIPNFPHKSVLKEDEIIKT